MRDIALTLVIGFLLLLALRRAHVGAFLWAWLSIMNPHKITFGFAFNLPFAQLSALVTLIGMLNPKARRPLPMSGGVICLLLLWGWMTITSVVSINPSEIVWDRWVFMSKTYLMLCVTLMLLRGRQHITILVWIVVMSLTYFGYKGGVFTLMTGGGYRVYGPPGGMMEDNNALAAGLIVVLPLIYFLRQTAPNRWLRWFMASALLFVTVSILGSQSRGALVGLLVMAVALGLKSKHPVRFGLVLAVGLSIGIAFMPDSWTTRMDSIQEFEADGSAMSRIYTWTTLWNVALDRPLVGAGFRADTLEIFGRYAPTDAIYDSMVGKAWVAHSIYFQALGEHGFPGLAFYLGIWIWVWFKSGSLAKQAQRLPELADWMPLLLRMCQVAILGFCAGGAFLSLMALDLPYYVMVIVTLCQCALKDAQTQTQASAQPVVAGQRNAPPAVGVAQRPGAREGSPGQPSLTRPPH